MKTFTSRFCATSFFLLTLFACKQASRESGTVTDSLQVESDSTAKTYINPVLDVNFPDPTVIKGPDNYYYVYGTNTEINGNVVNIQVARSKDLVSWEHMGDALPQKPSWADSDFWAPHVLYDSANQTYYLYYSGESTSDAYGKCLGVATSKSPAGPFTDNGEPLLCGESFVNIDPMAFDDPATGKKLLYWGSGHEPIKVRELTDNRMSFKEGGEVIELVQVIPEEDPDNYQRLVEGPWVVLRGGYYYLFYSGDNCCGEQAHYAVMVARSESATGPFETLAEKTGEGNSVILEKKGRWVAPGHNSIITDDVGQDWIVYHAIDSTNRRKGRVMLIDKIIYKDGWPLIENGAPSVTEKQKPATE